MAKSKNFIPLFWKKNAYSFRFRKRRLTIKRREIKIKTPSIGVLKKFRASKKARVNIMINKETNTELAL